MNDFGNTMSYALVVTLFGMGIVFIVLILLQYILESMRIIFAPKKKAEQASVAISVATPVAAPQVVEAKADAEDEEELFAVITAAVACCTGSQSNIIVRSITRINDQTPAWGRAGRSEQMLNRF